MSNSKKIALFFICIFLGVLIGVQYKTVQNNYLAGIMPSVRSAQLKTEIESLRQENSQLNQTVLECENKLANLTANADSESALIEALKLQLAKYRLLSGVTDVVGEGVIITLDDAIEVEGNLQLPLNIIENEQYIQLLVNELAAAGAEVMSINDQRILSFSEIKRAGNQLYVNGTEINSPIVIKAIGNSEVLDKAITAEFAIGQQLRTIGFQLDVRRVDQLDIYKYSDAINYHYAEIVEE